MIKPKVTKNYVFPVKKEELPLGPGSAAGVLVDVNSGWRTFRPVVNNDNCSFCLRCWLVCPDGVIDKSTGKIQFDYDYCKGCGICAYECPKKCISMVKEGD